MDASGFVSLGENMLIYHTFVIDGAADSFWAWLLSEYGKPRPLREGITLLPVTDKPMSESGGSDWALDIQRGDRRLMFLGIHTQEKGLDDIKTHISISCYEEDLVSDYYSILNNIARRWPELRPELGHRLGQLSEHTAERTSGEAASAGIQSTSDAPATNDGDRHRMQPAVNEADSLAVITPETLRRIRLGQGWMVNDIEFDNIYTLLTHLDNWAVLAFEFPPLHTDPKHLHGIIRQFTLAYPGSDDAGSSFPGGLKAGVVEDSPPVTLIWTKYNGHAVIIASAIYTPINSTETILKMTFYGHNDLPSAFLETTQFFAQSIQKHLITIYFGDDVARRLFEQQAEPQARADGGQPSQLASNAQPTAADMGDGSDFDPVEAQKRARERLVAAQAQRGESYITVFDEDCEATRDDVYGVVRRFVLRYSASQGDVFRWDIRREHRELIIYTNGLPIVVVQADRINDDASHVLVSCLGRDPDDPFHDYSQSLRLSEEIRDELARHYLRSGVDTGQTKTVNKSGGFDIHAHTINFYGDVAGRDKVEVGEDVVEAGDGQNSKSLSFSQHRRLRLHWGYLLTAMAIAATLFVGSLIVLPEWTRTNGWVFILLGIVIDRTLEAVANWRTAFDTTPKSKP